MIVAQKPLIASTVDFEMKAHAPCSYAKDGSYRPTTDPASSRLPIKGLFLATILPSGSLSDAYMLVNMCRTESFMKHRRTTICRNPHRADLGTVQLYQLIPVLPSWTIDLYGALRGPSVLCSIRRRRRRTQVQHAGAMWAMRTISWDLPRPGQVGVFALELATSPWAFEARKDGLCLSIIILGALSKYSMFRVGRLEYKDRHSVTHRGLRDIGR